MATPARAVRHFSESLQDEFLQNPGNRRSASAFYLALQYGQRSLLDHRVATFPIGTSLEEVVRELGRPMGTMHETFPETKTSTDTLTYGFGIPLALFSPQEWELEFADYKLIRKSLLVSP